MNPKPRARRRPRLQPLVAGCVVIGLLGACSPHSVRRDPPPPLKLPDKFQQREVAAAQQHLEAQWKEGSRWWLAFEDPVLAQLIDQALSGSFDVQAAWARLQQAGAAADAAGAPLWPQLTANVGANYQRMNLSFVPGRNNLDRYGGSGSLEASYELDVWAKISSTQRAAALDREIAGDQLKTLAMSLSAEVADAYYDVLNATAQHALLQRQQELSTSLLKLVEFRFGQGLATAVEVDQQRQQVLGSQASLAQVVALSAVRHHRLATLLGTLPGELTRPQAAELPALPPLPAAGVPSDLLRRRPDLIAAQRRVEAADYRVAAAVADRFPSLRLTGAFSSEPGKLNDWLLSPFWNLAANLALPIIDGGRRRAEVERTRGRMAELVAEYGKAVLGAIVEVENALVQERQQQRQIEQVVLQLEVARRTYSQAQLRYGQGTSDFLSVLTALRSQQDVERSLLDAQRQLLSYRVQLCRALGGTWMSELQPAGAEQDQPAAAGKDQEAS